jgi:nicotinate-nucleotide adenylyltransferase
MAEALHRVGIFGGTFDPVHLGHLVAAEQAREQARLDQVAFVPAARPPHKMERSLTPFGHRVEMLSLAVAGHSAFRVEELERDRPGPSYTVDTLEELHRTLPDAELALVLGADCLPDLKTWREPERIGRLAEIVLVPRPGIATAEEEAATPIRIGTTVKMPLVDISSHDIRQRVSERRSIRYLVPRAVECYIETHSLYRSE